MTHVDLATVVRHLDELLETATVPDYPNSVNGLQLENGGTVRAVAAAVDFSRRAIDGAVATGANFLVVHHGMFWSGARAICGPAYGRLRTLIDHDVAVYSSHLPLDRHPTLGNNVLLARELGLSPERPFARFKSIDIGVAGEAEVGTIELVERARTFARGHGGDVRATEIHSDRRTRRWAVCTGAGASADTLGEAAAAGIDTLIVGEGPHWTAVDARETGLAIIYAGHYATEVLGVRALAEHLGHTFGVRWSFVAAPTTL